MQPDRIVVPGDRCRDSAESSKLEWLETNGTGGFAMGTVWGANTRRYHALLVASLRPPVERYVLLSRLEEEVRFGETVQVLGTCQYPGVVAPRGFEALEEFRLDPCPTWRYAAGVAPVEKQVFLVEGRQTVVIRYVSDRDGVLRVRPFLAFRDYHSLSHANQSFQGQAQVEPGQLQFEPYKGLPALFLHHSEGRWEQGGDWYYNVEYLVELERGLDFREDLFCPGVLELTLKAGEPAWVLATIENEPVADAATIEALLEARRARREGQSLLDAAADQFLVERADGQPTIIAGYPWFTDWGRDTMISLPGLLIARGRLEPARRIIEGFLRHLDRGIIPNRFPDACEAPEYNTVDATLWMFQAVKAYQDAGGDGSFVRDVFYPAAKEIIDWHRCGTWYGIAVDPHDRLLRAGSPGTQLTWMDAKVGDWVVTPRQGKPVEINALWYNALRLTSQWAAESGEPAVAGELAAEADRVRDSFRAKFWNPSRECLYDVVRDQGPSAEVRPNQIFAVSLPFGLLDPGQDQAVVRMVEAELLTPVGLRTLEPRDPNYKPRYEGDPAHRDAAYHQGTVWPWLLGPYITAYLKAFGPTEEALGYCRGLVAQIEPEFRSCGLGTLAEIYDGDPPHRPAGCPAQAWSIAELLRVWKQLEPSDACSRMPAS